MKKNIILISLVVLFIPFIVKAEDDIPLFYNFKTECDSYTKLNETVNCTLIYTNSKKLNISGAKITVTAENAEIGYKSNVGDFPVQTYNNGNGIFVVTRDGGLNSEELKLLTFTFKPTSEKVKLSINPTELSYIPSDDPQNAQSISLEDVGSDLDLSMSSSSDNNSNSNNNNSNNTVKDSDASLKDLKVNGVSFSSSFSSGKYEYSAETNASEVTIEATANSSKATVSGTGKKTLKDGDNKFEITVTAENGNRSKYTIIVTKTDKVTDTSVTTTEKSSTKNPKTGVYSITIIGIVALAISTVIFINRKKLNLFKKI